MLSDEPIDEDLESLLYAQVYYGKEQESSNENEFDLSVLRGHEQDQAEIPRENPGCSKYHQKKRYFEHNLVQRDIICENTIATVESNSKLTEEPLNSENSVFDSTIESNPASEISDKSNHTTQEDRESSVNEQHQFIKISTSSPSTNLSSTDSSQIVTTTLLSTPSELSHCQLLNDININQYLPSDFAERLRSSLGYTPISRKCKSDLYRLKKGLISEQRFFNNIKRRLKAQRKSQSKIRAYLKRQQSIALSEVICLSDSENSDIEVVGVTNPCKDSKMKEKVEISLEESDNDEIIYVAPPPVPVINIDTESDCEASDNDKVTPENVSVDSQVTDKDSPIQNLPNSQLDVDEASDDFLQPKNTPDNFNFSLHGSDFQNADFVRPLNPTDVYETESSTSTSDFNRDSSRQFCNTVKTIVFNEVEFPNQDIFDESNLETFGEFITPKRGDTGKTAEATLSSVDKSRNSKGSKEVNLRTFSESSSESEYEDPKAHQNLPDLSPMVCAESSPKKGKKNVEQASKKKRKGEEDVVNSTKSCKRKGKDKFSNEYMWIQNVTEPAKGTLKKLKRKSSCAIVEEIEISKKKSKRKKTKSGTKSAEENEGSETSNSTSDKNVSCASPKKNSMDNCVVTSSTPLKKAIEDEDVSSNGPDKSCRKKNKKKGKKKSKAKEPLLDKPSETGNVVEGQGKVRDDSQKNAIEDNSKKKNKKRKQKDSLESRIVAEASSTTNEKNKPSTRIDIGKECNSLNKSSGRQEIMVEEQNDIPETSGSKKKNKRRKRVSTDKRNSLDESSNSNVANENAKDTEKGEGVKEGGLVLEGENAPKSDKNIVEVPRNQDEEDVILIEKDIPVHTIDSSDSDDDILTFEDVGLDLELVNIKPTEALKVDEVVDNGIFDVEYVQSKMSDNPEKWKILESDRYNLNITKRGPRCNRCRQFGHISINCPNKPALPVCALCGETGHQEPRCPNKVCFTCGKLGSYSTVYCYKCVKQRKVICTVCSIPGHKSDYCPDLWRRYFLTTTEGPLSLPLKPQTLKSKNNQWCSGCASNGHLEFKCNDYKWIREYPASSPKVFHFKDVYQRRGEKTQRHSDPARIYNNFVAKVTSVCGNNPPDNNLELAKVTAIAENRNDNAVESLETHQITNIPSTVHQDNPGTDSGYLGPNHNQPTNNTNQNTSTRQTNRGRHRHDIETKRPTRLAKINPLSVVRPSGFTPYRSVLNPCSLFSAPSLGPPQGLFTPVPGNILAKQLASLTSANYQASWHFNQNDYEFPNQNQSNFYQVSQFGAQIPPNPTPFFEHQDFSDSINPHFTYGNREFWDMPHTITRDPTEEGRDYPLPERQVFMEDRERQLFIEDRERQPFMDDRQRRPFIEDRGGGFMEDRASLQERNAYDTGERDSEDRLSRPKTPIDLMSLEIPLPIEAHINDYVSRPSNQIENSHDHFISLNTAGQENVREFNRTCVNVDGSTTEKFNTSSLLQLKGLVSRELCKLKSIHQTDAKIYKKKLNTIDHLKKIEFQTNGIKKQMYFLFKQINMFLFGVHRLCQGRRNLDYLRYFTYKYDGGMGGSRRKALLKAYGYIFGGERPDFNYRRYLNNLTVMNKK